MIPYSKLSTHELKKIIKHFCCDINATKTALLLWLNRKTINTYFLLFRQLIYINRIEAFREKIGGEIEVDESYFWPKRLRWFHGKLKRWRGTLKQPVFGLIKRQDENGRVEIYTEIIPNCQAVTLHKIIQGKLNLEDTTLYSDGWRGYHGLVDVWLDTHYRVNHSKNEFSKGHGIHINGIENFWSFTKRRLNKFNGVKVNFKLHLKDCEWRYWRDIFELERELLTMLRNFYRK